jgi:hypothetical protein
MAPTPVSPSPTVLDLAIICKKAYSSKHDDYVLISESNSQFIYKKTKDNLIIAFRGSNEKKDWLNNFTFIKTNFYSNTKKLGRVHSGFDSYYQNIRKTLLDLVSDYRQEFPDGEIVITGHSLGGCCVLFAAEISEFTKNYKVVTFGSPRIGDSKFYSNFDNSVCLRFVNRGDLVTELPTKLTYKHVGINVLIGPKENSIGMPGLIWRLIKNACRCEWEKNKVILTKEHDIDSYINRIKQEW